jgi:anti-anti-sigma factor
MPTITTFEEPSPSGPEATFASVHGAGRSTRTTARAPSQRRHGTIAGPGGLGSQDHVCWLFDERAEFVEAAIAFLRDGMRLGQRLMYVASGTFADLEADLGGLGSPVSLIGSGSLVLYPPDQLCGASRGACADQQMRFCDELVARAQRDGYTGVRFAADMTGLAAAPLLWSQQVRWEQAADAYMDRRPLAALCGYHRGVIGPEAAAAIACVHPLRSEDTSPFCLFVLHGELRLEGEVDAMVADQFRAILASAAVGDRDAVIDAFDLSFLDSAAVGELAEFARRVQDRGRRLFIRDAPSMVRRVWDLLGFSELAVFDTSRPAQAATHGGRP